MAVVRIELTACINCGWCRRACPTDTIKYFTTHHRTHIVEPDGCIDCGICVRVCPVDCIEPDPYVVAPALLEDARVKAKAFAASQRRMQQGREAVARGALEKLAGGSASHA